MLSTDRSTLLTMAAEQCSEGIAVVDLKGDIVFVNHAFASMHGYRSEDLVGKNLAIFHSKDQLPAVAAANKQILETGHFSGEIWHVRSDGTPFPTLMNNSTLRDASGKPVGMIGTIRDISEQKAVEEKLKAYSDNLEQLIKERTRELDLIRIDLFNSAKLAAMGRMGAGIAHQLNSPLCGALLLVDALLDEPVKTPSAVNQLNSLRSTIVAMKQIIDCMLSLAKVNIRGQPELVTVDINAVLKGIVDFAGLECKKRGVAVSVALDSDIHTIQARRGDLDQVFLNLVNNAIDAMEGGGTLSISSRRTENRVEILVSDTGCGILRENMEKIFEPFFTTRRNRHGLGLGLSISREIVERYGGSIRVARSKKTGTEFVVTIPLTSFSNNDKK